MGVCVCVCGRADGVFREHSSVGVLASEDISFSENVPPRTFSISRLQVRIGVRNSLAKFGKRPLKTCFIHRLFDPSSENTSYIPISSSEILLYSTWLQKMIFRCHFIVLYL